MCASQASAGQRGLPPPNRNPAPFGPSCAVRGVTPPAQPIARQHVQRPDRAKWPRCLTPGPGNGDHLRGGGACDPRQAPHATLDGSSGGAPARLAPRGFGRPHSLEGGRRPGRPLPPGGPRAGGRGPGAGRGGESALFAGAGASRGGAAPGPALRRGPALLGRERRPDPGGRRRSAVHLDPAGGPHRRHHPDPPLTPGRVGRPLALLALLWVPGCATLAPRSRPPSPEAHILEQVPVRAFEGDHCGSGSLSLVLNANGDPVSDAALNASLPRAPGGGVLSVDLLLAARKRGFDASLAAGDAGAIRREIGEGRPVILLLKLLDLPGERRDVSHYVVVDGFDPRRQLFRLQFGDGKARWAKLERVERAWRAAGHALLTVRRRWDEAADLRRGVELEASGRLAAAAETYRTVLEAHPASVRAWVNLA